MKPVFSTLQVEKQISIALEKQSENKNQESYKSPDQVAQLIAALSQHAKVVGSILGQSTYEKQPMNA